MTLNDLLPSSTLTAWLPLLDAIAKATIILGVAGLTTVLLRRASAASRHLVWTAALLAALVLPVLSMALPRWQMAVVTLPSVASPSADGENTSAAGREMAAAMRAKAIETRGAPGAARGVADTTHASRDAAAAPFVATISWPAALVLVWAAGAALVLGRLLLGLDRGAGNSPAHDRRRPTRDGCRWLASWRTISRFRESPFAGANALRCRSRMACGGRRS